MSIVDGKLGKAAKGDESVRWPDDLRAFDANLRIVAKSNEQVSQPGLKPPDR
jgi:hypothetical protein